MSKNAVELIIEQEKRRWNRLSKTLSPEEAQLLEMLSLQQELEQSELFLKHFKEKQSFFGKFPTKKKK